MQGFINARDFWRGKSSPFDRGRLLHTLLDRPANQVIKIRCRDRRPQNEQKSTSKSKSLDHVEPQRSQLDVRTLSKQTRRGSTVLSQVHELLNLPDILAFARLDSFRKPSVTDLLGHWVVSVSLKP